MLRFTLALLLVACVSLTASAGTGYEVTAKKGDKTITYMVKFGGGRMFEQYTAYDPVSDKFVYLTWDRGTEAPKPVGTIWDHETGRKLELYQFPDVDHPLPIIPTIDAMKVCPRTGDRDFKTKAVLAYD